MSFGELHSAGASKREMVAADWALVTRDHTCSGCGMTRCLTEHKLARSPPQTSHYECKLCGEICDTFSRIRWNASQTGYDAPLAQDLRYVQPRQR